MLSIASTELCELVLLTTFIIRDGYCSKYLQLEIHMAKDQELEVAVAEMSKLVVATFLRNVITVPRVLKCFPRSR